MSVTGLDVPALLALAAAGACLISLVCCLYVAAVSRAHRALMQGAVKELYGTMKKIEGLTAGKREQILREYDRIVQDLRLRLPSVIAAQASDAIFDTEKTVLQRLAEIDPSIRDEARKEKLDELLRSMERLQETIVQGVCETVQKSLAEARREIASDESTVL